MRSARLCLFAALLAQLIAAPVVAQTVFSRQIIDTAKGFGAVITNVSINADRWTGWVNVDSMRSVSFDIDYVRGAGAATAVTLRCETWGTAGALPANDAGRDLHVMVSTSAAGVTTSEADSVSNGVAADESWTWTVTNLPAPFINCAFRGTGANANDRLTVFERGLVP